MTERPILMSAPMVRALLSGAKTQTRRVVKGAPVEPEAEAVMVGGALCFGIRSGAPGSQSERFHFTHGEEGARAPLFCPHGVPGDTLWVRETWSSDGCCEGEAYYRATAIRDGLLADEVADIRWRPSIHMPRWASRITLKITDVRVERLQDISETDARAEGAAPCANGWWFDRTPALAGSDARGAYYCLWEHIYGPGSWAANPWVWALTFERVTP